MTIEAAGLVIFRFAPQTKEIQFLLLQATYEPYHWTPPKGHKNNEETDEHAAFREVREETGYQKGDLLVEFDCQMSLSYMTPDGQKICTYWLALLKNPDQPVRLSYEHQAYKWAPLQEARDLTEFGQYDELFTACYKYITDRMDTK